MIVDEEEGSKFRGMTLNLSSFVLCQFMFHIFMVNISLLNSIDFIVMKRNCKTQFKLSLVPLLLTLYSIDTHFDASAKDRF